MNKKENKRNRCAERHIYSHSVQNISHVVPEKVQFFLTLVQFGKKSSHQCSKLKKT